MKEMNWWLLIMNYKFLITETNSKALNMFRCFHTTSSVKLFVVTVQIFVYNRVFVKEEKNTHKTFHILKMKKRFEKEPYFENESLFRNPFWKWRQVRRKVKSN